MSMNTTSIANRLDKAFQLESWFLNNTKLDSTYLVGPVSTYFSSSLSRADLDTLRIEVDSYKDSLPDGEIRLFGAVNRFLVTVELEYVWEQVGNSSLVGITLLGSNTPAAESLSAEQASVNVALQNAIGTSALPSVGYLGATSAVPDSLSDFATKTATAIGDAGTSSYTLLGVTTAAASDLSTQLANFVSAVQTKIGATAFSSFGFLGQSTTSAATSVSGQVNNLISVLYNNVIGNTKISPDSAVTVKSCLFLSRKLGYRLDETIYTTSHDISTQFANMVKCSKWVDDVGTGNFALTKTGLLSGCESYIDAGSALAACQSALI